MTELLQDYLSAHAAAAGDDTAIVMGATRLTYNELESAANRLARVLRQAGCKRGDRVCLFTPKAPEAIAAMLAVLKVGAVYVPVDIASPAARLARIVRAADPTAILVLGPAAAAVLVELQASGGIRASSVIGALASDGPDVVSPEFAFGPQDINVQDDGPLEPVGRAHDVAHILFTSGSSGEPKGVMITHANVASFIEWAVPYFGTHAGDRISGHPPLHFDLSTFDIYATFRAGAELHLVPPTALLPRQLAEFIEDSRLTQWFTVPSTLTYMAKFAAVPENGFSTLERILWCGEVLPTAVLIHWMKKVPQATFTNLYGPTEATIASSYYRVPGVPDETAAISIGQPCEGEELLVLEDDGKPVPSERVGELYIGGVGVSPGYWRDEAKTRAAFVPDLRPGREGEHLYRTGDLGRVGPDGLLYFLGRTDSQIKSRGYRIELGEIEAALNALPEIAECAVLGMESEGFEGTSICCAYALTPNAAATTATLHAALRAVLPSYMLPARWQELDVLPKNVNGKIDRRRLRERFERTAEARPGGS